MGNKILHFNNKESRYNDTIINNEVLQRCFDHKADSCEIFTLIWLDKTSKEDSLNSLRTKNLLFQLSNKCLFYNNSNMFLHDYEQMKIMKEKILLIVSGAFAEEVLPKTTDLSTIIIFCNNYNKYFSIYKQYSNVCDLCTEHESLLNRIQSEIPSLKFNLFNNQTLRTIRPLTLSLSSQNSINTGAYFSYISFIDILKQMPKTKHAKKIMINKCLDYYRNNHHMIGEIESFRETYIPEDAILWYLKESFVYKLVNQAFRTEDVTLWYLFRFYITDLSTQLETIHKKQNLSEILTLYRGQPQLPNIDFDYLKSNIGGIIATNGFFSTSRFRSVAQSFLESAKKTEDTKIVLFEITVNPSNAINSIFVDINMYTNTRNVNTNHGGEYEVLFDIGSVFKIENVELFDEEDDIWLIKMRATNEGIEEMKEQLKSIRKIYQTGNLNMLFGRMLINMGHYSKAESYFQLILQVVQKEHVDRAIAHDYLGDLHMRTTNWNEAFNHFNHAYKIKKNIFSDSNHPLLAISLNNIGNYYLAINDIDKALHFYEKALKCNNNENNTAITIFNIGNAYNEKGDYDKALQLCIQARDQLQQNSQINHVEIIHCQRIIGNIYYNQEKFNEAEQYYFTAFSMANKYLPVGDIIQINCIQQLIEVYEKIGNRQAGININQKQFILYSQHLSLNHISFAHLLVIEGKLCKETNDKRKRIDCYEKALNIFETNIHYKYASTADCLMLIGQHYEHEKIYKNAIDYYKRAYEIQQKIYPNKHPILLKTDGLITSLNNTANICSV